jgi:hypothetical protein
MPDEMFFSNDEKSLIRGSRTDPRTETCRPCTVQLTDDPSVELNGVVLDVTPRGMLVRMMEAIPLSTNVTIQLMRDDKYQKKLSTPHTGSVRRIEGTTDGFFDHGILLKKEDIKKASERPVHIPRPRPARPSHPSRMQTVDYTVENSNRKHRQ